MLSEESKQKIGRIRKGSIFKFVDKTKPWNPFGYTQESVKEDPFIKVFPGKQNKNRGTVWKKRRKAVKESRRKNRRD